MSYYDNVKSNVLALYRHCLAGGFIFNENKGILKVLPAHAIDKEMADLILLHKGKLIDIIKGRI